MNHTSDKTSAETFRDIPKALLVLRNYDPDFGDTVRRILKDEENLTGNKSGKNLLNKKNHKEININYLKVNDWSLDFLCDFIESNHHKYIRKIMPKIITAGKIFNDDVLIKVLIQLNNDLEIHMQKEEKLLFPYIKNMNKILNEKALFETPPFGSIQNLIKVIEKEHDVADMYLMKIRNLCKRNIAGNNDLRNKKLICEYMTEFESDFHFHTYLENNILFPKAISLEKKLKKISINIKKYKK
ncbi:MAG TPA: hemerythrin domain-containing protein [Ignavibacteria bacterium]|nr:hemerythrin domain-containing protein [Ignavibacteria bacterium]